MSNFLVENTQVKSDLDSVRLLVIVALIIIVIDDQVGSARYIAVNVVEGSNVVGVGQHIVPGDTLDCLLGTTDLVHFLSELWLDDLEVVLVNVVLLLLDHPVGIGELDCLIEVGQVLVNIDLVSTQREAPFSELFLEVTFKNNDDSQSDHEKEERRGLVNIQGHADGVTGDHVFSRGSNGVNPTIEDLSVSKHPEAVYHEEKRSLKEKTDGVLGESVIKTGRLLISVSNTVALKHPEDNKTHDSNRE